MYSLIIARIHGFFKYTVLDMNHMIILISRKYMKACTREIGNKVEV